MDYDPELLPERLKHYDEEFAKLWESIAFLNQRSQHHDEEIGELKTTTDDLKWWKNHLWKSTRELWRMNILSSFLLVFSYIILWLQIRTSD